MGDGSSITLKTNVTSETCPPKLEIILETPDDAGAGYVVEADVDIPLELHDKFEQFQSLAPEVDWLNDYQKEVMENASKPNER